MASLLKLYIPVVNKGIIMNGTATRPTYRITLINSENCQSLRKHIPSVRDISEHLKAQKYALDHGGKFTSIKANVTPEEFEAIRKEISQKIGKSYQAPIVDLIFESGQVPIIQILMQKQQTDEPVNIQQNS